MGEPGSLVHGHKGLLTAVRLCSPLQHLADGRTQHGKVTGPEVIAPLESTAGAAAAYTDREWLVSTFSLS